MIVRLKLKLMNRKTEAPTLLLFLLLAITMLEQACGSTETGGNQGPRIDQPSDSGPTAQGSPKSAFERDLEFIRKGGFTYVWVFSRRDGKPLDKEDASYLRKNAPQVVDWVTTDEGRRVIAGTNFNLEEGNLDLLSKRFVIEDYSGK